MTNEETEVIRAARAIVRGNPHPTNGLALELRDAVQALDLSPVPARNFWVNYQFNADDGRTGEGCAMLSTTGSVSADTVSAWRDALARSLASDLRAHSVSVVVRTWTELEG